MSAPIQVLVLNERDPLHPKAGGAEVHVAEIARRLAPLGFELTQYACASRGAARRECLDGLVVERLGPLPLYYPRAMARTVAETSRRRFDLVVEHLNKLPFCSPAYSRAPVLAVNHHLFGRSAFLQASWPVAATVVAIERLIPRIYRNVPFLAVSESSRQDLVARGVCADHIELLYNGIVFPEASPRPPAERPCRVVYLGRLERYKRVDLLLRACAQLLPRFAELELVLVGRGAERAALERLAVRLGLAERVRFAGFVPATERDALVADARVAVCPSVKEGWGLTVVECNALGVPVVATDAPGLRDAVRPGETGALVPDGAPEVFSQRLAHALASLLADEAELARLATGARAWARRFDWDASAQRMAEALRALLRPPG